MSTRSVVTCLFLVLLPSAADPVGMRGVPPMRQRGRLRIGLALPLAAALVVACATGQAPTSTPVSTPTPSAPDRELINPNDMLADAARYGDLVFTSGFLGDAPGDDFAADVENSLDSLEAALAASGAGFDTLLKVNVYLTDWNNWETFNSIYHRRIEKYGLPPRTTVEVTHLGFDAPIEIAVIAHVRTPAP